MRIEAATPDEYFALAGDREVALRELDRLIRSEAPALKREMLTSETMNMVGYGMFHYKSISGREGDWPVIALANQKNYMSLYLCATEDGKYMAEANASELGKVSVGRSCVRFKKLENLNLDTVKKILQDIQSKEEQGIAVYEF